MERPISSFYRGRRVLVTGGSGLIGIPLVKYLVASGAHVSVVSMDPEERLIAIREQENLVGVTWFRADLTTYTSARNVVEGHDFVFQLAGSKGSTGIGQSKGATFFRTHLSINMNMLKAAAEAKVERYLLTSTVGVYPPAAVYHEDDAWTGPPNVADLYGGWAKRMSELFAEAVSKEYGIPGSIVIVRPGNCFSSDTMVLTPLGFRNIKDLRIGNPIYTLNPKSFEIEEDVIVRTVQQDSLKDIEIKHNRGVNWKVTPDHKLFLSSRENAYSFHPASILIEKKTKQQWNLPVHRRRQNGQSPDIFDLSNYLDDAHLVCVRGADRRFNKKLRIEGLKPHNGSFRYYAARKRDIAEVATFFERFAGSIFIKDHLNNSYPVNPVVPFKALVEFLGWYISEGNVSETHKNSYQVCLAQYALHRENRKDIIRCIKSLGFRPSITERAIVFSSRMIKNFVEVNVGTYARNKRIPAFVFSLNYQYRKLFLDTLMRGDGNSDGTRYSTVSSQLAEDVFHLSFLNGFQPYLVRDGDMYRIHIRTKKQRRTIKSKHAMLKEYVEPNSYYCVTTSKNHIIFAGREGAMGWIGQCYGPWDDFNPQTGMAVAALIARAVPAEGNLTVWGDGTAMRDFTFAEDVAYGMYQALEKAPTMIPLNLSCGKGYSVRELVEAIMAALNCSMYGIQFDTSKPTGAPSRILSVDRARQLIGFDPTTSLVDGIRKTVEWYQHNAAIADVRFNPFLGH